MIEASTEVAFNRRINGDTWLMGLRSSGLAGSARPGQFVMLRVREGAEPLLRRPFSICGTRGDRSLILYRVVGKGTEIMSREVREGDRLSVLGPLGMGFRLPVGSGLPWLVGGGIGIAPLLFLAASLAGRPLRFLAGFGSKREIIPVQETLGLEVPWEVSTDDGSAGRQGLVTDLLEEQLLRTGAEGVSLYSCGPRPMLRRIASIAASRGLSCQVSLEAAMACGLGACQGCAVKASTGEGRRYYHVCKDGPVFRAEAIDWGGP